MILIVTRDHDPPVARAQAELEARGARVVRFDPTRLARDARLVMRYAGRSRRFELLLGDERIDLDAIDCVWYRKPHAVDASAAVAEPGLRALVREETGELLAALWDALDCRFFSARPAVLDRARRKPVQQAIAQRLGLDTPATCITTMPDELVDFYRANDGRVVTKLVQPRSLRLAGLAGQLVRFTEPMTRRDLGHSAAARHCPTFAQAYVPKALELRITVVGARAFAVAIDSQRDPHARHDWRHALGQRLPFRPYALPREVEERCLALAAALELAFGAIDMVLTPDGRHVFLEINPNGEYDWIEHKTKLPITQAICDELAPNPRPARRLIGASA